MARSARISISRDKRNAALPFQVNLAASLSSTGKRERRNFPSRAEAERFKAAEEKRLHSYSEKSYGLTDAQKIEAAEVLTILARFPDRTPRDAAILAADIWGQEEASIPLADLGAEFERSAIEDKRDEGYASKTRNLLKRLAAAYPGAKVSAITAPMVDRWLRAPLDGQGRPAQISAVTRNNYRRHLSAAFGFACRKRWLRLNPCADVETASTPKGAVAILTPEQAEALLRAAHPKVVAWFALGLFAGIRPMETERLAWSDISAEQIRIRATIAKTRRNRFVPALPVLHEWLARAERAKTGLVGYSRFYREQAFAAAGLDVSAMDVLRHTFGTYRWVILQHEGQLAQEMGNSPQVIVSHYRALADRETAERFFSIAPNNHVVGEA